MSDIHVITGDLNGDWSIVMHYPVPVGNNSVNVPWVTALANSQLNLREDGRFSVLPLGLGGDGTISVAEEALLEAGQLFEVVESLKLDTGPASPAEQLQLLFDFYNERRAVREAQLSKILKYFGFTTDKP
jgi:hypothetical protein